MGYNPFARDLRTPEEKDRDNAIAMAGDILFEAKVRMAKESFDLDPTVMWEHFSDLVAETTTTDFCKFYNDMRAKGRQRPAPVTEG